MTLYVVLKNFDADDNLYYEVSPYNLNGTIACYLKYYSLKELFAFLAKSRLSEKQAKKLAVKKNKTLNSKNV